MQRKYWDLEYKYKGKLWRGISRERDTIIASMNKGLTLDAGCGNGKDTPFVENLVGMDFSRNALRLYPFKLKVLGDITSLPFRNNSFSNILYLHSLDHLLENERIMALEEAYRILDKGGKVIMRVFSINDFRYGKGIEVERDTFRRGNKIYTHYFTVNEFDHFTNFKVIEKRIINYYIIINKSRIKREELFIILSK